MRSWIRGVLGVSEESRQVKRMKVDLDLRSTLDRGYEALKDEAREIEAQLRRRRIDYGRETSPTVRQILAQEMRGRVADLKRLDARIARHAREVVITGETLAARQEIVADLRTKLTVEEVEELAIDRDLATRNAESVDKAVGALQRAEYDPHAVAEAGPDPAGVAAEAARPRQGTALPRDLEDELRVLLPEG